MKIMISTIAGIFDYQVDPDEQALRIAYPIASTNNLYAWPILTKNYNEELRNYADQHDLDLMDLEEYIRKSFNPRSKYFDYSVHPNEKGYIEIGTYFANKLKHFVQCNDN